MLVSATEIKNYLGKYLKICQQEDVFIAKNDKIIATLSSYDINTSGAGDMLIRDGSSAYNYTNKKLTFEEFLKISENENNEQRYEFINGEIFLLYSPGFFHQLVQSNLYEKLTLWFKDKKCRVLSAPLDIIIYNKEDRSNNSVQPDLMIICDHDKMVNEKGRYTGIPSLVVEVLSVQTRNRDLTKKLNLYLWSGINEYWAADPVRKQVVQYYFVDNNIESMVTYKESDVMQSLHFKGLEMSVEDVWK